MVLRVVQRAYEGAEPGFEVVYVDLWGGRTQAIDGRTLTRHDTRIDTDAAGLAYALRHAA